ncbi:zinc-binding dehydrogenase [Candidatus Latescibacterota bacterium]
MKSRAMVITAFNEPLVPEEIEVPTLEDGEVLIKLTASGVCGSDVHMWRGEDPRTPLPLIPGHEGVGTVADIGGKKRTVDGEMLSAGDGVFWNRGVTCGECWYCSVLGDLSLCSNRRVYGITSSRSERPYLNGCYAEYLVLRTGTDIFKIPGEIDHAVLVSASCSGATAAHAFDDVPESVNGGTVVVQGVGPLGVYAVAFARSLGASSIAVIGGTESRLDLCRDFGATHLLNRHKTTPEERKATIEDLSGGRGADLVVEAVGAQGVAEEGVRLLRKGGMYVSTGYAQPAGTESLDFYRDVVNRNVRIQGIWVSDSRHLKKAVDLTMDNADIFARLVSRCYTLDDANSALTAMERKEVVKAVICG